MGTPRANRKLAEGGHLQCQVYCYHHHPHYYHIPSPHHDQIFLMACLTISPLIASHVNFLARLHWYTISLSLFRVLHNGAFRSCKV
jgi:hypothetical protein